MKIIAGIPAYNKQYPVCGVIHAAEEYVNEVIVVDDGSTDNTSKLAKRAGAVVLRHETNKGKTAAVQTKPFLKKKSFTKRTLCVFLLAQVFFFLKRKSVKKALPTTFLSSIKTLTKNGFIRFGRTARP